MRGNRIVYLLIALAMIVSVAILAGCDNLLDREHILLTIDSNPTIKSIGFSKANNTSLSRDCFATSPKSVDKSNRIPFDITIPGTADESLEYVITFEMSSDMTLLYEEVNGVRTEWKSGVTRVKFDNLHTHKNLVASITNPFTKKVAEKKYKIKLNKSLWIRLKDFEYDHLTDNGQNVILYLQIVNDKGVIQNYADTEGSWVKEPVPVHSMQVNKFPPVYDNLSKSFPVSVKPFENGIGKENTLSIKFENGCFVGDDGSVVIGRTVSFPFEADWIGKKHKITFNLGNNKVYTLENQVYGGKIDFESLNNNLKDEYDEISMKDNQIFLYENLELEGWYRDEDTFLQKFDEDSYVTGDMDLFAKWIEVKELSKPGKPKNVTAVFGNQQVTIKWEVPENTGLGVSETNLITNYTVYWNMTNYTVYWNMNGIEASQKTDSVKEYSLIIGELTNGTKYTFHVTATNEKGESERATVTETPATYPEKPKIISIRQVNPDNNSNYLEVKWNIISDDGMNGNGELRFKVLYYNYNRSIEYTYDLSGVQINKINVQDNYYYSIKIYKEVGNEHLFQNGYTFYFQVSAINSQNLESARSDIFILKIDAFS